MFSIPTNKIGQINAWQKEQHRKNAERQGRDNPYYGAAGGVFTYEFTPTNLGTVIVIKDGLSGEFLDITDYDMW